MNYVPPITTLTLNDETTLLISRSIDGVTTVTEFHPSKPLRKKLRPYLWQRAGELERAAREEEFKDGGMITSEDFFSDESWRHYAKQVIREIPPRLHLSGAGYRFDPTEGGPISITLDVEKDGQTVQEPIFQGIVHEISPLHSVVR